MEYLGEKLCGAYASVADLSPHDKLRLLLFCSFILSFVVSSSGYYEVKKGFVLFFFLLG